MTSANRAINKFSQPTTLFASPGIRRFVQASPESAKSNIYTIVEQFVSAPVPVGFREMQAVIAEREQNPRRAAALKRARQRLADRLASSEDEVTVAVLRMRAGLSQARVAELLGNSQSSYSMIESGRRPNVMFATFERLANIFSVSRDELAQAIHTTEALLERS